MIGVLVACPAALTTSTNTHSDERDPLGSIARPNGYLSRKGTAHE